MSSTPAPATAALAPLYTHPTTSTTEDNNLHLHILPPLPDGFEVRGPGQPTKLTSQLQEEIVNKIEGGTPVEVACALCGICKDTFQLWVRIGRKSPDSIHGIFLHEVKLARQRLEDRLANKWARIATQPTRKHKIVYKEIPVTDQDGNHVLDDITGELKVLRFKESETVEYTGDGDWRGIAEFLARRYKSRWAKSEGIELTGANGGPVDLRDATVPLEMLPVELRRQILMALEGLQQPQQQIAPGVIDITPNTPGYRVAGMPCEGSSERVVDGWVEMEDSEDQDRG